MLDFRLLALDSGLWTPDMFIERHSVSLTTAADGSATGFTPNVTGRVLFIRYLKTDFDNGVDLTITTEAHAQTILTLTDQNASGNFLPRLPTHDETGAEALYAAAGAKVREAAPVVNDRVKVVVAQGGNVKTGTIIVFVG